MSHLAHHRKTGSTTSVSSMGKEGPREGLVHEGPREGPNYPSFVHEGPREGLNHVQEGSWEKLIQEGPWEGHPLYHPDNRWNR